MLADGKPIDEHESFNVLREGCAKIEARGNGQNP